VGGMLALALTAASAGANPASPAALEAAQSGVVAAAEAARGHQTEKTVGLDRAIEVVTANLEAEDKPGKGPAHAALVLALVKNRKAGESTTSPSSLAPGQQGLEKVAEAYKEMRGNAYGHDKVPGKPAGTPGGPSTP
ncbi:MAG: hypothetical protein OEM66_04310, partial [Acidimicrobiia bacterium]|nr:hypothetical protein [Acidimicrobiia bacterium]